MRAIKIQKNMKKILLLLFACCASDVLLAQSSITPTVISTQGDYFTSSSGTVSWTLGEIVTETLITSGNGLTQGFQQPDLRTGIYVKEIDGNILSVYPNPTMDDVVIDLSKMKAGEYQLTVIDIAGNLISTKTFSGGANENVIHLSFQNYASGTYLLVINNSKSNYKNNIKIFKTN